MTAPLRLVETAEVEPITTTIEEVVGLALISMRGAERHLQECEGKVSAARRTLDRRRLELGRALVEARKQWPARGPNAKGWGEFLASQGIEQQRASEWMRLAGYVETISPSSGNDGETPVPTYAEAGIDRRPRRPRKSDEPPVRRVSRTTLALALEDLRAVVDHVHGRTASQVSITDVEAWVKKAIAVLEEVLA